MKVETKLLAWSDRYSVGIKIIDEQHKELIDLINDMYDHVNNDDTSERIYFKAILRHIIDKIKTHFETEEKILRATNFQGYAEHKKTHDSFLLTVIENILKFESGKRVSLVSFTIFFKNWILSHILMMDKQYYKYFRGIASRRTNGRLSITSEDIAMIKKHRNISRAA